MDDAPPAKKQKVDKSRSRETSKQAKGKQPATPAQTVSQFRDSNEDDFKFIRKPKKSQKQPAPPQAIPEDVEPPTKHHDPPKRKGARTNPSSDGPEKSAQTSKASATTRRSKRLSGEDAQSPSLEPVSRGDDARRGRLKERPPDSHDASGTSSAPQDEDTRLRIERKRRDTKIALPFADTPVIQRNREMRQISAENRRRSSSTMRGRRASSLIDSGTSNAAVPHHNVAVGEFYKHISNDIPEPRRMKQLLTWCGSRALIERPGEPSKGDVNARLAAKTIQDEMLTDFTNKSESSDWFSREEEVRAAALVKKPHPRNVQNASQLQELEAEVQRLEQEKVQWTGLFTRLASSLNAIRAATEQGQPAGLTHLENPQQTFAQSLNDKDSSTVVKTRTRLKQASTALEFKVDSFADGVHKLTMLDEVVREVAEGAMSEASGALQQKQEAESQGQGASKPSAGDLLRALSRTGR
ncbi:MAG: hypothetical protein Q9162_000976 [Coniocarpon cinnabarinum]